MRRIILSSGLQGSFIIFKSNRIVCWLLCCFHSSFVLAQATDNKALDVNTITVVPKVCASQDDGVCRVNLDISYQADRPACLYASEQKLACIAEEAATGGYQYFYQGKQDLTLELLASADQRLLAVSRVKVLNPKLIKVTKRRRQRNPWSLF